MDESLDVKIGTVWFRYERIFIKTENGDVFSRPLEAFPVLKNATAQQRENYVVGRWKDDVRWPELDEDIHVSSFLDKTEPEDNEIARIFARFPELNVSQVAERMGINKNLLYTILR